MNTIFLALVPVALAFSTVAMAQDIAQDKAVHTKEGNPMSLRKMTPNLYTDDVRACARFWVDRLHFEQTMEVPEGDNLAFVSLHKGSLELMYGSYKSLGQDPAVQQAFQKGTSFLFIEVENLDEIVAAMQGAPIVAPVHKTFYGSTEFTVKDPAGHLITFAQFGKS